MKEIKKTSKWTEEDEHHWMMCLECVEECATQEREDFSKTIDWLKSLKDRVQPQKQWRPSKEQLEALHDLNLTGSISFTGQGRLLIELYNDLKELQS